MNTHTAQKEPTCISSQKNDNRIAAQTAQEGQEGRRNLKRYSYIGQVNIMSVWRVLIGIAYTAAFVYAIVKIILE